MVFAIKRQIPPPPLMALISIHFLPHFLAVQDSSKGDLVTQWVSESGHF